MQSSPVTDNSLGIKTIETKFSEVRSKATKEERIRKTKRNKTFIAPKFAVGDIVVIASGFKTRDYCLVEVIDLYNKYQGCYNYFGIVLKTTTEHMLERCGRLVVFEDSKLGFGWIDARCEDKGIKWIENDK
jgi:CO dehydrogenase nickel-insertion accessory protein CooC1